MSDVKLYTCVVCGRHFSGVQALRGHMKVHRGMYMRTSILVPVLKWPKFKEICDKHGTTTCMLLDNLISATIKGEELGVIKIGSPNPVIIQVQEYFTGKPRSWQKVPVESRTPVIIAICPLEAAGLMGYHYPSYCQTCNHKVHGDCILLDLVRRAHDKYGAEVTGIF